MKEVKDIEVSELSASELLESLSGTGFQATNLGEAFTLIEKMKKDKATIFLAFTANMVASGLRGIITELCKRKFIDVIVTTAGSTDHDIIKSFEPYNLGDFNMDDTELHRKGINRLGNILIDNKHFSLLEEKMQAFLKELTQKSKTISPSELNSFIGSKLNESSFLYWCEKNRIPVFCPGITDGAIGLQMYFFKQDNPDFCVDVTRDMKDLADLVIGAKKTAGIILGGGISKHHVIGTNIVRGGLDSAVYITTASEYDGSLSGAQTREAKSWGKIQETGKEVTVVGDTSILFPLLVLGLKERGLL
jgi:deoxyhypusine synthase